MAYGAISKKQKEVLEYIKKETLRRGFPPAVREICTAVSLKSTSSVHAHLESLEKAGYIRRDPAKPRAIEILDEEFTLSRREVVNLPLLKTVQAGKPVFIQESISGHIPVPSDYMVTGPVFMMRAADESMINAGIFPGDCLLVRQTTDAQSGDIVVAALDGGATVKTYYREKGRIRLQPENDALEPLIVSEDISILGQVFGVFRLFK